MHAILTRRILYQHGQCDMSLKIVASSGMHAQAGVNQTSTTRQQKKKGSRVQAENKDHRETKKCLSHTLPLAETRRKGKLLLLLHRTRSAFELTRICWTLKPDTESGKAFQLAGNSLDTLQPKDKHCYVCHDFTAARCDHRANNCR